MHLSFPRAEKINRGSPPSSRRRQRSSALHLYFQVLCPTEKSDSKSYRTFLAGALGLEFQVSGIYGVFETFVFLKHHFHPIYSIIFNCSFCVFPLKGNRKGKNMGNKQVLTTPQYTRVWASHLINRDAHKKGGRRILCNFTEIRSYQA